MRQIEVRIMGQSYLLGCAQGAEQELLDAVTKVDQEMCAIRDGGKLRARERIAVLAALNLASQLSQKTSAIPAAAPPSAQPHMAAPQVQKSLNADCDDLIRRIDDVLGADGHLI